MDYKKLGLQTIDFAAPPVIISHGNVVGTKEGQGPLKNKRESPEQYHQSVLPASTLLAPLPLPSF